MYPYVKIFFVGMMVSFVGSLPLGSMNIAAMQISITDGYPTALSFATGLLLVEIVYVRISLVAMDKIRRHERILKILEWVTVVIIAALAVSSFIAAAKDDPQSKNILLSNGLPRFVLGLLMSALNPVQIPFWFGWSTALFTKKILLPRNDYYNVYIAGIGLGTFLATCVFIFAGKFFVEKLAANQNTLHWIIGGVFAITAILQFWKIMNKKDAFQKVHALKEENLHVNK